MVALPSKYLRSFVPEITMAECRGNGGGGALSSGGSPADFIHRSTMARE